MKAWIFQDTKQLAKHGAKKCPWSVGWYDGRGRKKQKAIGAKTTAKTYARKLEGEAAAGLLKSHDRMKWPDFVDRFDRDHLSTLASVSRQIYLRSLDGFSAVTNPTYMDQIDESLVDRFRAKRHGMGVEPATVNKDLRCLRCALNKARKWRLIPNRIEVELLREPERDPDFIDDVSFAKLYAACDAMNHPGGRYYPAGDWWRALLTFAYLTGWRIGEIMALRRDNLDWTTGVAFVPAEQTKGKRDSRVQLHPVVLEHLKGIASFEPMVFDWPHHERTLWADFKRLKAAAGLELAGAFHRFRFGFAQANVGRVDDDVLQQLMRHRDAKTTRHYVNMAERMRLQQTAGQIHIPAFLSKKA